MSDDEDDVDEPLVCSECGCTDAELCDPNCAGMRGYPGECAACLETLSPSEVWP